jgi:WD40 repeat protein
MTNYHKQAILKKTRKIQAKHSTQKKIQLKLVKKILTPLSTNLTLIKDFGPTHTEPIRSIAISPTEDLILTTSDDGSIKQWTIANGSIDHDYGKIHTDKIMSIAISNCGVFALSASFDKT